MSENLVEIIKQLAENDYKTLINLNEQARPANAYESTVTGLCHRIIEHLLKLFLFGKNIYPAKRWIHEIDTWFETISLIKTKPNNKPLPLNKLLDWGNDYITDRNNNFSKKTYDNRIKSLLIENSDLKPIGEKIVYNNSDMFINLYSQLLQSCSDMSYSKQLLQSKINEWFDKFSKSYK